MVGGSELDRIDGERVVGGSELDRIGEMKVVGGRIEDMVDGGVEVGSAEEVEGGSAEEVEGGSVEVMQIISIPADMKQKVDHNILQHLFSSPLFFGVFFCFCVFFFASLGFFAGISIIKHKCMASLLYRMYCINIHACFVSVLFFHAHPFFQLPLHVLFASWRNGGSIFCILGYIFGVCTLPAPHTFAV